MIVKTPSTAHRVAIAGIGEVSGGTRPESLETLIFTAATAALDDAGLSIEDIDGVVTACADQVDGRAISSMVNSGPAGGHLRDEVNLASSGAHALIGGYLAVAAGRCTNVLVSAWGKASEGNVSQVEHLTTDPYFDRDLPLTELSAMAMQAQTFRSRTPGAAEAVARIAGNGAAAESPLVAAPLRAAEVAPYIDGAFSVVLSAAPSDGSRVELLGAGWASDRYRLSERDLVGLPHLRNAAERAYAAAGIGGPDELDFAELHDYCIDAELLACSAVGLGELEQVVERARATGDPARDGTAVNPSGGSLRGEAPFANGLQRAVGAVRRLRAADGRLAALVQSAGGFAGQFQTVVVLGYDGGRS